MKNRNILNIDSRERTIAPCLWHNMAQYLVQLVRPMAQSSNKSLDNLILQVAPAAGEGASLKDFLALPDLSQDRRKVQRRLQVLVKERRLRKEGNTRGARYWLASSPAKPSPATPEDYPPLSPTAVALRAEIRKPIFQHTPVPYRRKFLDDYRPNETFYLPEAVRGHLKNMGQPA